MTKQSDVIADPNYRAVLDHGFVGIVETMGTDASIVQAARVSYGAGTKTVSSDRALIRYMMRHRHTSPVEMIEVKFHIKAPIFVLRQQFRHRTHSANEESSRYSIMSNEYYLPVDDVIQPQSSDNKQGRAGDMDQQNKNGVRWVMQAAYEHANSAYQTLLGDRDDDWYDLYSENTGLLNENFTGVARELARIVQPVGSYSSLYWKQNLWNLFHFLHLRLDNHAQYEIRVYAQAMYDLIQPLFPIAVEAFDDYIRGSKSFSRMDRTLVRDLLSDPRGGFVALQEKVAEAGSVKLLASQYGMSDRELKELVEEVGLSEALTAPRSKIRQLKTFLFG